MRLSILLACVALCAVAHAQTDCDGTVNNHQFIDGGNAQLLKTVKNGKLYKVWGTERERERERGKGKGKGRQRGKGKEREDSSKSLSLSLSLSVLSSLSLPF
jgi:hypothetical protein